MIYTQMAVIDLTQLQLVRFEQDPYERDSDDESDDSLEPDPEDVHIKVTFAPDTMLRTFALS